MLERLERARAANPNASAHGLVETVFAGATAEQMAAGEKMAADQFAEKDVAEKDEPQRWPERMDAVSEEEGPQRWSRKKDVAAHFGMSEKTIERWMREGMPFHKKYVNGAVLFRLSECDEWFSQMNPLRLTWQPWHRLRRFDGWSVPPSITGRMWSTSVAVWPHIRQE